MAKKGSGQRRALKTPSGSRPASAKRELVGAGTEKGYVRRGGGGKVQGRGPGNGKSATGENQPYVRTDAGGAMRVGMSDVPIDSVVAAFDQGHSPEMIRAQYPSLALEEVYGAIAYYLANRKDVDAYLKRQDALWAKWRARTDASPAPVVQRLRAAARAPAAGTGASK